MPVSSIPAAKPSAKPSKPAKPAVTTKTAKPKQSKRRSKSTPESRAAENYIKALKEVAGPAGGRKRKQILTGKTGKSLATSARALDRYLLSGQKSRQTATAERIQRVLLVADRVRKSQQRASRATGLQREALAQRLVDKAARLARGPRLTQAQKDKAAYAKLDFGVFSTVKNPSPQPRRRRSRK